LGSVSKALTATLLAILVDKQQIDLDQEASTYFPALPALFAKVTPRMLASHTAGVQHYSGIPTYWLGWHPAISGKNYASVEDGLSVFIDEDLLFPPGTAFEYSTYGYSLLSRLMEGATNRSFETLLRDELFVPAGMNNTDVDHAHAMENRVSFYTTGDGKYTDAYPSNSSYKIAGGGIVSTPSDLASLGQMLLGRDLLSENSRTLLWTPTKLPDGSVNPQSYGMGWRINESTDLLGNDRPTPIIHHGGTQNGGAAFIMIVPEYGISVAATSNSGSDAARGSVQDLCYALVRDAVREMTSSNPGR
jgi:CubicO group peptidase (beta-lactamase class C family)